MTDWPEWLTPEHSAIHTAIENEIKRALQHCIDSADAAGMDWTTEGWISVSASKIMGMLRRAGCPPPAITADAAVPIPLPRDYRYDDADADPDLSDVVLFDDMPLSHPRTRSQWLSVLRVDRRLVSTAGWTAPSTHPPGAYEPCPPGDPIDVVEFVARHAGPPINPPPPDNEANVTL